MSDVIIIFTTMPDDGRADVLARTLVEEQLAACVHVHAPIASTYRWNGAVQREAERAVVIKTVRDRVAPLEARLHTLHPYELPEFIVVEAGGSARYVKWINDAVGSR